MARPEVWNKWNKLDSNILLILDSTETLYVCNQRNYLKEKFITGKFTNSTAPQQHQILQQLITVKLKSKWISRSPRQTSLSSINSMEQTNSQVSQLQRADNSDLPAFQGKREERPSLLPLSGATAPRSGHNVAKRTNNTAKLATGSLRVLLLRMLLCPPRCHCTECRLPAAVARARRRNCWHCRGLVADQWRHPTIPTGKP